MANWISHHPNTNHTHNPSRTIQNGHNFTLTSITGDDWDQLRPNHDKSPQECFIKRSFTALDFSSSALCVYDTAKKITIINKGEQSKPWSIWLWTISY